MIKEKTIKGECSAKACFRITEPQGLHNVQISTRLGTARREGIAEGEARGIVKGEARGIVKGEARGKAKGIAAVLKLLRSKRVSPDVLAAVRALKSSAKLQKA